MKKETKKGIDKTLKSFIKENRYQLEKKDNDCVWAIVGQEGKGKTNIGIWCAETYKPTVSINNFGLDIPGFITALYQSEKADPVVFDEAGDGLNSRDGMSFISKDIIKAYMVCRGKNLFTILVLPDFFMLDTYFRKHRVRALIHVTARGKYSFYDTEKIKIIIDKGEKTKNINVVAPLYKGWFSKYDGPLIKPYLEKKAKKINDTLSSLYFNYVGDKKVTQRQACRLLNVGYAKLKEYMDNQKLPYEVSPSNRIYIREADILKLKAKLELLGRKKIEERKLRKEIKSIKETNQEAPQEEKI
jgi:hypothetical protein